MELIPNDKLEQKIMIFEMMPDVGGEEDYYGEDSDRELTAEEQEFIDKIDETLPDDIRELAKNPDSVFEGVLSENPDFDDEDNEDDDEEFGGLPAGYMEAVAEAEDL